MFNPGKTTKDIKSFYVNADTNLPVEEEKRIVDFKNLCRPDMKWITKKCMMKSAEFREMIEENYKAELGIIDELVLKDQNLYKKHKKRLLNNLDFNRKIDIPILHTTFMNCSTLYDQECRKFYETRRPDEKFTMI
jgi:hypothetical protein